MTAKRISKAEVFEAVQNILESGEEPSVKSVHGQLGRGTAATVEKYLNQWFEESQTSPTAPETPDEFIALAHEFYVKLTAMTHQDQRQREAALSAQLAATNDIKEKLSEVNQALEEKLLSKEKEFEAVIANLKQAYEAQLSIQAQAHQDEIAIHAKTLEAKLASQDSEFQDQVTSQSKELIENRALIQKMVNDAELDKEALAAKEREFEQTLEANNDLQTELTKRELRIRELAADKNKLETDNENLHQTCLTNQRSIDALQENLETLKARHEKELADVLNTSDDDSEHEINALKLTNKELEATLSRKLELKENELNWVKEELEEKQNEIIALNKTTSEANVRYQTLEMIKKRLTDEIANLTADLDEVNSQNTKLVHQLASLEKTVFSYSAKIRELEGKAD